MFEEGGVVVEGDTLYTIDPALYRAAVTQAEAAVSQAEATLSGAQREADRITTLSDRNVASQQGLDDAIVARDVAAAALDVANAQLQSAMIELDYTSIRAGLSGEIGFSTVSPGALVTASQAAPMAIIRNIDPVNVDVTQSAAELLRWRRGGTQSDLDEADQTVALTLADGSRFGTTGQLTAAEPVVDELTGVVILRLQFANPDKLLLPGMYVQVDLPTGIAENVFVVPQEAVGRDRRGTPTALVVNGENVVELRELVVLQDRGADWIVSEGLAAGDRLIVEGLQKAPPGTTVIPEERAVEAAAANPPAADDGSPAATQASDAGATGN